jgi:hypothetical protein
MKSKAVYLILCVVGVILPYSQFVPWMAANGLNLQLFFHEMLVNRISSFFVMDGLVSAVVLLVFVRREGYLRGATRWLPLLAVLMVGVSLALPLYLYLRERKLESA